MSHNFSNFYPLDWSLTTEWTSKFRRWVKNSEPRLPIFSSSGVHYLYPQTRVCVAIKGARKIDWINVAKHTIQNDLQLLIDVTSNLPGGST